MKVLDFALLRDWSSKKSLSTLRYVLLKCDKYNQPGGVLTQKRDKLSGVLYSLGKKNQSTRNHSVLTMAPVRKTKTAATARPIANAERRLADTHLATAKRAAERDARRAADGLS